MRFLEAWTQLSHLDQLRQLAPIACLAILVFLPGRRVARWAALAAAVALLPARDLLGPGPLRFAWAALWGILALGLRAIPTPRGSRRPGWFEGGTVGLVLAVVLLVVLVAAIAREDLNVDLARRATEGIVILCLGLLHLMLRHHIVRFAVGLVMLGLGIQVIELAARASSIATAPVAPGLLLGTTLAAALALRIGHTRERVAASPWVTAAHDLHD